VPDGIERLTELRNMFTVGGKRRISLPADSQFVTEDGLHGRASVHNLLVECKLKYATVEICQRRSRVRSGGRSVP